MLGIDSRVTMLYVCAGMATAVKPAARAIAHQGECKVAERTTMRRLPIAAGTATYARQNAQV